MARIVKANREFLLVKAEVKGVPAIQRRIVADYRSDVRKYAEGLAPARMVSVLDSVPVQLEKATHDSQWDVEICGSPSHNAFVGMEDKLYQSQGLGEYDDPAENQ